MKSAFIVSATFFSLIHETAAHVTGSVQIGARPFWLVDQMRDGSFKDELTSCMKDVASFAVSDFSIGHRGAAMQYPEHTRESYQAALDMGAGIVECDVTFTKDRELVCRHSQCDLHTTTDIVTRPELNDKCTTPWAPGVTPNCCTSDFTLAEIKTLCAKMDSSCNADNATTAEDYAFGCTADWRTDIHATMGVSCPQIPTHRESIELIMSGNGKFTPELKEPSVEMPYLGNYSQEDYAQQMIDEYIELGIEPSMVWPQSFLPSDVFYWVANTDFGDQAVALDGTYDRNESSIDSWLDSLVEGGAKIVAPPQQVLVQPGGDDSECPMEASYYAVAARERGLGIITWTLERDGPGLSNFYYSSLESVDLVEGDRYCMLKVLHEQAGILGIFSDWPATVTFFANCYNISLREKTTSPLTTTTSSPPSSTSSGVVTPAVSILGVIMMMVMMMAAFF